MVGEAPAPSAKSQNEVRKLAHSWMEQPLTLLAEHCDDARGFGALGSAQELSRFIYEQLQIFETNVTCKLEERFGNRRAEREAVRNKKGNGRLGSPS